MSTSKTFGERIAICRKKERITQAELAEKLGLAQESRTTIAKWEHGATFPPCQIIPDLCVMLNCDAGYLFCEFDTPRKAVTDIRDETGLSSLAVDNLCDAAAGLMDGPIDEDLANAPHDNIRSLEIGRFSKIRFLELLLENSDIWEQIAVCAYDFGDQMHLFDADHYHSINGIRHDQFANVAKERAKEALAELFSKIEWDELKEEEWGNC